MFAGLYWERLSQRKCIQFKIAALPFSHWVQISPVILNSYVEWRIISIFSPWCANAFIYFKFCLECVLVYGKKKTPTKTQNDIQNVPTYEHFFVAEMILVVFKILFMRMRRRLWRFWDKHEIWLWEIMSWLLIDVHFQLDS